jgi:serine O-acetyltransferase
MSAIIESFPIQSVKRNQITDTVARLRHSREQSHNIRHKGLIYDLPSRETIHFVLDKLRAALFPTHFGQALFPNGSVDVFVAGCLDEALPRLNEQVARSLQFDLAERKDNAQLHLRADAITAGFAERLPGIRDILVSDFRAAYKGDPAAESIAEVVLCYRGTIATIHHRFAHELYLRGAHLIARLIADMALESTGIDIHPGASIGEGFFIDHGAGVVIGQTAIIGRNVRLYQGVTLGAKSFDQSADGSLVKGVPRHPILKDDVVIYAGATVLGRITIGKGSIIGGNVWLTHSVPPGSNITQAKTQQV